jgi:NAD(P)-dependent dehydrogenase (short-subunit alcohol dehydrogenase family)
MESKTITVVTGGGRGIGKAIALRMSQESPVMIVGRTKSDLQDVCRLIKASGGTAYYCIGDVARPTTARRCVERVHKLGLTVGRLVTNAGIGNGGSSETFPPELFAQIQSVNVNGTWNFVQACLPDLLGNEGAICMISSLLGVRGFKRQVAYAASKHAIVGMARSLAHEFASRKLTVVPLCPTFVESEMTDRTINGLVKHRGLSPTEARKIVEDSNPQKRIIPAEEVAEMVAFVCSGKCTSINGNPIIMSGGD